MYSAQQGEVGDDHDLPAHVGGGEGHLPFLILEDPKARQLGAALFQILLRISFCNANEGKKAFADAGDFFSFYHAGGAVYPLNHDLHTY